MEFQCLDVDSFPPKARLRRRGGGHFAPLSWFFIALAKRVLYKTNMEQTGGQIHPLPNDDLTAYARRTQSTNSALTEGFHILPRNSYQSITEQSVTSTAGFGQSIFPGDYNPDLELESSSNPIIRPGNCPAQEAPVSVNPFRPTYGGFGSAVSDHRPPIAQGLLESLSTSYSPQMMGMAIQGTAVPDSRFLRTTGFNQGNPCQQPGLDNGVLVDATQGSLDIPMDMAFHTSYNRNHGPGLQVPHVESPLSCRPPWSTLFPRNSEVPLLAVAPDITGPPLPPRRSENLVDDYPSTAYSWTGGP